MAPIRLFTGVQACGMGGDLQFLTDVWDWAGKDAVGFIGSWGWLILTPLGLLWLARKSREESVPKQSASSNAIEEAPSVPPKPVVIEPVDYAWLKSIEKFNEDRLSFLVMAIFGQSQMRFRELTAPHDQFFEIHFGLFNSSIFTLDTDVSISGDIGFQDRPMHADITIARARAEDHPWSQGHAAGFAIKVVPRSSDTVRILRAAAEQNQHFEIYPGRLTIGVSVLGRPDKRVDIQPFLGTGDWRSDIYERPSS
ncbi:MAG TPA: hypothetical protein VJB57_13400 [Dehalococcoidia bacterium]|nr:hypothetical protein [Dehalococcoidia bacterium]